MKKIILTLTLFTSFSALAQTKYMIGNHHCEVEVKMYETDLDPDTMENINSLFEEKGYKPMQWPVEGNNYSVIAATGSIPQAGSFFSKGYAATSLWSSKDSGYVAKEEISIGLLGGAGNKVYRTAKRFVENHLQPCKKR